MSYRLGLDIGANSIGWCCLSLDETRSPNGILDIGVRIFSDGRNPKDGTSLAAARRLPRSMRRNRDRYLRRRNNLLNELTRVGLMPPDAENRAIVAKLNPYQLRADALERQLEPHELGRVLFHLNQRRGFKSNRKVDRAGDNESGLIKTAARDLTMRLTSAGHVTLGQFLADRHSKRQGVRIRLAGSGKEAAYPFYPLREMIEAEFDAIWEFQSQLNSDLSVEMGKHLKQIIFFQRPLRDPVLGRCWLEPEEPRGYRAMPSAEAFRIAQDLSHLRLSQPGMSERPLADDEPTLLRDLLLSGRDLTFDQIRKKLKLSADTDFNLATLRKDKLVGATTAKKLGAAKVIGPMWHTLTLDQQDAAVTALLSASKDEEAAAALKDVGIDEDVASRAVGVSLIEGTTSLSLKAIRRILPHLEAGLRYDEAVNAAGYGHHSDQRTGELRERLPYYGELLFERIGTGTGVVDDPIEKRWGRAPNPTVHVALNELRRVVNAVIDRHGAPSEIVVETLRDLGRSAVQKRETEREQRKNQDANDRRKKELTDLGLPVNGQNLIRLRLWEEQASDPKERRCPYTGTIITARMALSDEIEEDHTLPFAVSLDDSTANRVLVTRTANRQKSRRTPYEAFGHTLEWEQIQANIESLPANKRWRFAPDALQKFTTDGDFLARHLTDSSTIARLARLYLEVLTPGHVWSTPGRLTALLRSKLGLNSPEVLGKGGRIKDRTDNRHHAVDAIVVALTDRGLLHRISTAAGRNDKSHGRLIEDLDDPWPGFVAGVAKTVRDIAVSQKPDTGWQGALHNDTAYGLIETAAKDEPNVVVRRPIEALVDWTPEQVRKRVRDGVLGEKVVTALASEEKAQRMAALERLTHSGGHKVRRVRTVERLNSVHAIADRRYGNSYKAVKLDGNHRAELWRLPTGKFTLSVVSVFDAAQEASANSRGEKPPKDLRPHPAAKLIFRVHKNDTLALGAGAERQLMRIVKMGSSQVVLAPISSSGNLKARDADKNDSFNYFSAGATRLVSSKARKVWIDPIGRVHDRGPPQ